MAKSPGPVKRIDGPKAKIVPVHLAWEDESGSGGLIDLIGGCLPAGQGVDVVWSGGQLYLMKEKGRLQRVYAADGPNDGFGFSESGGTSICFDGRYVWASLTRRLNRPLLIVLDPQSGQTWTLGPEEGLPVEPMPADPRMNRSHYFAVGPVAPGKACIAGYAGPAQIVLVEFEPETGAKFEILSLDKLASTIKATSPLATSQNSNPLAGGVFKPIAVFNLSPPGDKAAQRIAVSHVANRSFLDGPLLIDPATRSIEAVENNAMGDFANAGRLVSLDGATYWIENLWTEPRRIVLVRAGLPKLEDELVFEDMPDGSAIPYGDRIAFLGEQCWLWKPGERQIESLEVQVPWIYRSTLREEPLPPPRKIAGDEWQLDRVFPSQHYGALVLAEKFVRPSSSINVFSFFQFALADDPRIESESPPALERRQVAIELSPGTAASELRAFASGGDNQRPLAGFGKVVEAEPDDQLRYPILAREIVRQALLIAARDQLQWTTRDETLSESVPPTDENPAAKWVLATRFPYASQAELTLHRVEADGAVSEAWQERVAINEDENHPLDYAALVAAAERWSREAFPPLLKQGGLSGEPNPKSDDAEVSPATAEWLKQMTFAAQFAALRELHHAIRRQGESAALVGALSRAYANLGVLSEFHWSSMHKVCKARALLYAERLVARDPQSAQALWHRAYAKAFAGLHDSAVADLDAAAKLPPVNDDAAKRPRWVEVVEAYGRFDAERLAQLAEDQACAQLAGLLQFFQLEGLKESTALQTLAQRQVQTNPECFRLLDAMCDSCAISTQHLATEMAPAVLHRTTPLRLKQLSGLPPDVAELLERSGVRKVGLTEISDSLLQTAAEDDREEFSWRILGRMIQEVEFIQIWRRVWFMRFQWAVPADDFIESVEDVATGHRYRALVELCSTDSDRWRRAAETLTSRLELEEIEYSQQSAFEKALGDVWQTRWTEQYVEAARRPALHIDDVHRDLLARVRQEDWDAPPNLTERLLRISSESPDVVAVRLGRLTKLTPEERVELLRRHASHPQVLQRLADWGGPVERKQMLRRYIKLSPDAWAYRSLAEIYRKEDKLDEWQAVLDEGLEQPAYGLEHAQLRVEIANHFMDHGEWEKARPYAEVAAESWAEWAMLCAIRCYHGLGEDEQEGVWRSRIVERYPETQHWLDYYVWARRTGDAQAEDLLKTVEPMIDAIAPQTNAESQYRFGLFYQLGKRPKKALAAYRKSAEGHLDLRHTCFDTLWTAAVAGELKETAIRDQALQRVANFPDPAVAPFRRLAEWLQACWRLKENERPDLKAARDIAAAAAENDRTGINCFIARALDLRGDFDDAVEFYQAALDEPGGKFGASYSFVTAVLRDHGIEPRKPAAKTKAASAQSPAAKSK